MKAINSHDFVGIGIARSAAYRRQASQLRATAQHFLDLAAQAQLMDIADRWQRLADELDRSD